MKVFLVFLCAAAGLCVVALFAASETSRHPDISLVRVPNGGIQPQAVMNQSGTLHLLYYSGDPAGGNLYYVQSSDAGHTWSASLRVNSESGTRLPRERSAAAKLQSARTVAFMSPGMDHQRPNRKDRSTRNRDNPEHQCSIAASTIRTLPSKQNAI
jgi:hypothetical protein